MNLFRKVLNFSSERYLKAAGNLFIYDGNHDEALVMVDKTLALEPDNVRALILKGDVLYCLNRDIEALDALNKALRLVPHSVEALISKAGVLDTLGRYRDALNCCYLAFEKIHSFQVFLLPSLFEQQIILLMKLKKFRQAQHRLQVAETRLERQEYEHLMFSYGVILEKLIRRRNQNPSTNPARLRILP